MSPDGVSRVVETHGLFIDNGFVSAQGEATYDVIDPSTEDVIAHVADGQAADVDRAVRSARKAFDEGEWPRLTAAARGRLLLRLADLIERDLEALVELESRNSGMPLSFARDASVAGSAAMLRYNAGWADKLYGETIPVDAPDQFAMTVREPVGVVGAIISWNVPMGNAVAKLAPALAAGCTMVLKVSEQAPLTAIALCRLVAEAGIPPGVFNLVTGRGTQAPKALVDHPLVDKIAFTGSTATGKQVMAALAPSLKRVSLELGGKSPVIVLPDADIERAAEAAAMGIFTNAGQICVAGSRLYVHRDVADRIVAKVVESAQRLHVGPGTDPRSEMGPLISQKQMARVFEYLDSGREEGMETLVGGERIGDKGFFVAPTVLDGAVRQARVLDEEIFGPVLCVTRFDDEDVGAVTKLVNQTRYGLSANVWTRDISKAIRLAQGIRSGGVRINGGAGFDTSIPFGGYKQSGIGRENGSEGVKTYTEIKAITVGL